MTLVKDYTTIWDEDTLKQKRITQAVDNTLIKYAEENINKETWGYRQRKAVCKEDAMFLLFLRGSSYPNLFGLVDSLKVQNYTNESYTDTSKAEEWLKENNLCITEDHIELRLYTILPRIGVKVKDVSKSCEFIVNFHAKDLVDAYKLYCTVDIIVKAINQDCYGDNGDTKLAHSILVKEQNCDLTYDSYAKLLDCNLSTKAISTLYECGATLGYSGGPILNISNRSYDLAQISVNGDNTQVQDEILANLTDDGSEELKTSVQQVLVNSYCNLKLS